MSKKVFIIIIILILLAMVIGVIYLYSRNLKVPEKLSYYIPRETVLYVEFDLKNKNLAGFYQNNFRARIRFESLFNEVIFFGQLSEYLIQESNRIALLIVQANNNWYKVWLVEAENIHRLQALLPVDFYSSILNTKTIALSPDRDALKLIKEIDPLIEHSAEQKEVLDKFSTDNFINIYLAGEYLKFLSSKPDPTYALILNNLNLNYEQPAFLGLSVPASPAGGQENPVKSDKSDSGASKIVYEFSGLSKDEASYKFFPPEADLPLADKENDKDILLNLPVNDLFLIFTSANLKDVFDELKKELMSEDQKQEWPLKYEFEWQDVEELLNYPGEIFVQSKSAKVESEKLFDLSAYNYGLLVKTNGDNQEMLAKIEQIKKVVKNILAFKYPIEKTKRLPDGTQSIELVADSEEFEFIKDENFEYLEDENFHFVVGSSGEYLVVGNSKDLIKNILELSNTDSALDCEIFIGQEMVIINSNQLIQGLLSFSDKTIINFEQEGNKVKLKGCLMW